MRVAGPRSAPDGAAVPDVVPSVARPTRALALALASRTLLVAILIVGAGVVIVATSDAAPPLAGHPDAASAPESAVDPGRRRTDDGWTSGTTYGALLGAVVAGVRDGRGTLVELQVARVDRTAADVRIVAVLPSGRATGTERMLRALHASGVESPRLRSIIPTPLGDKVEFDGRIVLSTRPTAEPTQQRSDASEEVAIALTRLVERTGSEMLRLEVPARSGTVRLGVRGDVAAATALLEGLEQEFAAPTRIDAMRVESVGDRELDVQVRFGLRPTGLFPDVTGWPG